MAHASDMLIAIWSLCEPEDREAFVTYLAISGHINTSVESRERQTAIEVSKPEATPKEGSLPSVGPSGTAAADAAKSETMVGSASAPITPSASNPAVTVADKPQAPRPSATVSIQPDPQNPEVDDGRLQPSANAESGMAVEVQIFGSEECLTAYIDCQDFPIFQQGKWRAKLDRQTYYLMSNIPVEGERYFHRIVTGVGQGILVDHKDGNGLNNCRENLRIATAQQNSCNRRKTRGSSQFKGVVRRGSAWLAQITVEREVRFLGTFDNEIDAARAYDAAAKEAFGEFARVNFEQPADLPWVGNEPEVGKAASVTNSKPDCLKLKDGHCKLSFSTSALCAECNAERMKRRAA